MKNRHFIKIILINILIIILGLVCFDILIGKNNNQKYFANNGINVKKIIEKNNQQEYYVSDDYTEDPDYSKLSQFLEEKFGDKDE